MDCRISRVVAEKRRSVVVRGRGTGSDKTRDGRPPQSQSFSSSMLCDPQFTPALNMATSPPRLFISIFTSRPA